ncbi:MAG: RNA polymerase sigma factor [Acetivibrio sp.]
MFLFFDLSVSAENNDKKIMDELILAIGRDEKPAFQKLYQLTDRAIYGYALSILKNVHDAEDIMQDTYIKIRETAHTYNACEKPMAWIITITRNLCLMKLRKNRFVTDEISEQMENDIHLSYRENPEDKIVLETAMKVLDDEERQIVMLHVVVGMKHKEIGEILQCPLGSVLSKYHRSLKKLREHL